MSVSAYGERTYGSHHHLPARIIRYFVYFRAVQCFFAAFPTNYHTARELLLLLSSQLAIAENHFVEEACWGNIGTDEAPNTLEEGKGEDVDLPSTAPPGEGAYYERAVMQMDNTSETLDLVEELIISEQYASHAFADATYGSDTYVQSSEVGSRYEFCISSAKLDDSEEPLNCEKFPGTPPEGTPDLPWTRL